MTCSLFITGSFDAYDAGTSYGVGAIVSQNGATFIALSESTGSPVSTDAWKNTRNIEFRLMRQMWEGETGETYNMFDVVETSGVLYMCRKDHVNDNVSKSVSELEYWISITKSCLLYDAFHIPAKSFSEFKPYFRSEAVVYNNAVYGFIGNDSETAEEIPGTETSIISGQQWLNITDEYALLDVNENAERIYNPETVYAKNEKVRAVNGYYVSAHNANYLTDIFSLQSWQFVHSLEAGVMGEAQEYNSETTYQWGDIVRINGDVYVSQQYENTTDPTDTETPWLMPEPPQSTNCLEASVVFPYDPNVAYSRNDVVFFNGLYYISQRDNNLFPITSRSWILCPDQELPDDCSGASTGLWTTETYYVTGQVAEFDGSFYIAKTPSIGAVPPFSISWLLCKGNSNTPCGDLTTPLWNIETAYASGNKVRWNNTIWFALNPNTGQEPGVSNNWQACSIIGYVEQPIEDKDHESLILNEAIKAFDAFVDFKSCLYIDINAKIYSFDTSLNKYVHQGGAFGKFHGTDVNPMVIKVVVNDEPDLRKIYDSIRVHAETNNIKFDSIKVKTNFVNEQVVDKTDHTYVLREGIHTMPARSLNALERLRGQWMEVVYTITGSTEEPYEFRFISSTYYERLSSQL